MLGISLEAIDQMRLTITTITIVIKKKKKNITITAHRQENFLKSKIVLETTLKKL